MWDHGWDYMLFITVGTGWFLSATELKGFKSEDELKANQMMISVCSLSEISPWIILYFEIAKSFGEDRFNQVSIVIRPPVLHLKESIVNSI